MTDKPHLVIFANPSTRGTQFQLHLDGTSADPPDKEGVWSKERKQKVQRYEITLKFCLSIVGWGSGGTEKKKKKITRENLDSSVFAEIKLDPSGLIHGLPFTSTNSRVAVQITEDVASTFFSHPAICSFTGEDLLRASRGSWAEGWDLQEFNPREKPQVASFLSTCPSWKSLLYCVCVILKMLWSVSKSVSRWTWA